VAFSFLVFHRRSAVKLAKYGSVLSVWTLSMLLISGLDVVIVGHYHYQDTGFYSVANGAATFMLALVSSAFGPLVPAVSSLQSTATPERLGDLCIRTTRYCTLLLLLLGLPLFFGAYPLLGLWVGKRFAGQSAMYLEVLVAANVVRQLAFAYILIVVATGRQHLATLSQVVEACVNIGLSIWLVQRIGTVGVALGTFAGAFVGLGMHLMISMPRTQPTIRLQFSRFLLQGLLRPLLMMIPALFFYPFWKRLNMLPAHPAILAIWAIMTAAIAWGIVLTAQDRQELKIALHRLLYWRLQRT
jgi:O-antigen/teichoic acid export membrane protein